MLGDDPIGHAAGFAARRVSLRGALACAELDPGQACECGEPVVGSGPVAPDQGSAGSADDRAQDEADDDRVVGVAEQRHEVGHEVDGDRQVGEEQ